MDEEIDECLDGTNTTQHTDVSIVNSDGGDDISQLIQNANIIASQINQKEKKQSDNISQLIENANNLANRINPKKPLKKRKIVSNVRRTYVVRDETGRRTYPRPRKKIKRNEDSRDSETSDDSNNDSNDPFDDTFATHTNDTVDLGEVTQENNLQQILIDAFKLVGPTKKRKRQWKQRVENSEGSWCNERDNLTRILVQNNKISGSCDVCCEKAALIRCMDCHNLQCAECDEIIHDQAPLHNRLTCVADYRQFLLPIESLNESAYIVLRKRILPISGRFCGCGSKLQVLLMNQKIIVITATGRYEVFKHQFFCKECQSTSDPFVLEKLLKSGYWPTTISHVNCIVSVSVFLQWDNYRKFMPGSSLNSFLRSLDALTLYYGRIGKISPATFSTAFRQWCFVQHELDVLISQNWMECPCCTINQHSCHVDGNCKLYRYKTSGRRLRDCYYEDKFIVTDRKVDKFVATIYKDSQPKVENDYTCGGEWNAARNSGRKKRSVDYTGLEVATCRHQLGQKALNMKRGEIFGYPLYLMKYFMVSNKVDFAFADVMCKLSKFVSSRDPSTFTSLTGALSVMHAKGHNASCQAIWDGEWIKGTGRSTGEEGEQLFSYLSRCSNTTKYQRPEHREEYITELVMAWNRRKSIAMPKSLCHKYIRVYKELEELRRQLANLKSSLDIDPDQEIDEIVEEIKDTACGFDKKGCDATRDQELLLLYKSLPSNSKHKDDLSSNLKQKLDQIDWPDLSSLDIKVLKKKKYLQERLLVSLSSIDPEVVEDLAKATLEKVIIPAIRTALDRLRFDLILWKAKVKKKASTCKQRFAFRKKQTLCTKKIENLLQKLTKISDADISLESPFPWDCKFKLLPNVSCTDRRSLAEVCVKIRRSEEELVLLKQDAASYVTYQTVQLEKLSQKSLALETAPDSYSKGLLMMIGEAIIIRKQELDDGIKQFNRTFSLNLEFESLPVEAETDEVISDENEENEENEENGENEENEEDEQEPESENADDFDLSLIMELGNELSGTSPISVVHVHNNTEIYYLSGELSQGTINGRNGSSACSLISLIAAYSIINLPSVSDINQLVTYYVGSMELGNSFYNELLAGLPHLPELPEAVDTMSNFVDVSFSEEHSISLPRDANVIVEFFKTMKSNEAMILIFQSKMVHLTKRENKFYFFDSHCHGTYGAIVLIGSDFDCIFQYIGAANETVMAVNIGIVSFLI